MDQAYWQQRYIDGTTGWDVGIISNPLKAYIDHLTNKDVRILIPGCGFGHEAVYLATQGFTHVTVIDLVDDALQKLRESYPEVNSVTGDFFTHEGAYNLILEQTLFCAILPEKREEYIKKVAELLADGGTYAGVLFDRDFEGGPPFGGTATEYAGYLEPHFSTFKLEPCYNSIDARKGTEVFVIAKK